MYRVNLRPVHANRLTKQALQGNCQKGLGTTKSQLPLSLRQSSDVHRLSPFLNYRGYVGHLFRLLAAAISEPIAIEVEDKEDT